MSESSTGAERDIAVIGRTGPGFVEALARCWRPHPAVGPENVASLPAELRGRIEVAVVVGRFGAEALAALPRLRFLFNAGIGFDGLDLPALRQRGVAVANLAGIAAECVADMAMALLLDVARCTTRGHRFVLDGKWGHASFPFVHRVSGRRLGILGLGSIGRAIARRAEGFGMTIAYHARSRRADVRYAYAPTPLALASMSDHLAIAAPGGPETRHLVNAAVLAALPGHGIVVNVGRGSIIDQEALIAALAEGRLFGAGLDVIDGEPAVPPALLALDNVVVTPHRAGSTLETTDEARARSIEILDAWFRDGINLSPV